jgi:hypothetical protein
LENAGVEFRERISTPTITIWAFLSQILTTKLSFKSALAFHQEFMPALQRANAEDQARLEREMLKAMARFAETSNTNSVAEEDADPRE